MNRGIKGDFSLAPARPARLDGRRSVEGDPRWEIRFEGHGNVLTPTLRGPRRSSRGNPEGSFQDTHAHRLDHGGEDVESLQQDPLFEGNRREDVSQEKPRCSVKDGGSGSRRTEQQRPAF